MSNIPKKTALVFPGQGAQYAGMGKELYDSNPAAQKIFDALAAIKQDLLSLCFEGSKEDLSLTINTQPCIFAVSMAHAFSLVEQGLKVEAAAGFSLGEVCALTFSGVLSLSEGFRAVIKRAEFMTECASQSKGAMSAVLKLDTATVEGLAKTHGVYPVNYNCQGQIVVSGEASKMLDFNTAVGASGGRAIPLAVSGAFHSPLMQGASQKFREFLDTLKLNSPKIPVYANATAGIYSSNTQEIKNLFASQIASPVLWEQTVRAMRANGIAEFIELEPGKVLTGLISKIT